MSWVGNKNNKYKFKDFVHLGPVRRPPPSFYEHPYYQQPVKNYQELPLMRWGVAGTE